MSVILADASTSDFHTAVSMAAGLQYSFAAAALGMTATVPASGSVVSPAIGTGGCKSLSFAVKSSQSGAISIQRYVDLAGTIPVGTPITGTLTANSAGYAVNSDNTPYQSLIVTVTNTGGSAATLTSPTLLLQAN